MGQPKLEIRKDLADKLIEIIAFSAIILSFLVPLYYYSELPEQVPLHFNASGTPDKMGAKNTIWILPGIGMLLYWGIHSLIKFPYLFNYPVKITATNAQHYYKMAQRSLRLINLIIAGAILYITFRITFSSLGRFEGLGSGFIIIFSLLMLCTPLFFMLKMRKY